MNIPNYHLFAAAKVLGALAFGGGCGIPGLERFSTEFCML
jgi:hypothetical protein